MWFKQLIREESGCATYMIASTETRECAVFDPLWDIRPYLEAADRNGFSIRKVIDSHSHADHVSGARRLCAATDAERFLPGAMESTYEASRLADGDRLLLGQVRFGVRPGYEWQGCRHHRRLRKTLQPMPALRGRGRIPT